MLINQNCGKPNWVSPPGETIINILEEREISMENFSRTMGKSISDTQKLLNGKYIIDSKTALRLSQTLGTTKSFWLAREHDYRASITQTQNITVTSLSELFKNLPVHDMQKFGWINLPKTKNEKIIECLTFFGVSSLAQWHGKYDNAFQQASYRQSSVYSSSNIATITWLRKGEIETSNDKVNCWSPEVLETLIPRFRNLTWFKSPSLFLPKLKSLLSLAGVKFTVVRAPKGCTASGAVRIFEHGTPHIQLSFKYLSDDQFWFTLFHELAHLLLHFELMPILENSELSVNETEHEANEFASNIIIPMEHREEFYSLSHSKYSIVNFAKKVGVAPGLIVGQLQHEGIIKYNQMQHLKRRYQWVN